MNRLISLFIIVLVCAFILGSAFMLLQKAFTKNNSNYTLVQSLITSSSVANDLPRFDLNATRTQTLAWISAITTTASAVIPFHKNSEDVAALDFTSISQQTMMIIERWFQIAEASAPSSSPN